MLKNKKNGSLLIMTMNRLTNPADNNKHDDKKGPFPFLDLPQEVNVDRLCPQFSLKECGLFAQASVFAENSTAFLRLLPSAVDAEPESYACDLFLMATSKTNTFKISDKTHLYLYKDYDLNQIFYYLVDTSKKQSLAQDSVKEILKSVTFNQPAENPVNCINKNICGAVLGITSQLGHTQQEDETKLAALAILKRYPELLFIKGMVTDHYGRKIWASPYQLFWGAGDTWALKQVYEEIIPNIKDGEAQAKDQFKEQFPHCPWPPTPNINEEALYDERNKEQIAQVIVQLKTIADKITADLCTNGQATLDETKKAVAELCQIFAPKEGEVIRTGLHFPLAIMKAIYKLYDAQNNWSDEKLSFFSREVIGAALAALTAVDGQSCKQGINNLSMDKGPDRTDGLFCQHPKGIPDELAPISDKLSCQMFVDPYDGESCFSSSLTGTFDWYRKNGAGGRGRKHGSALSVPWVGFWTAYGEQKQKHMGELMQLLFHSITVSIVQGIF